MATFDPKKTLALPTTQIADFSKVVIAFPPEGFRV
jgi:hypothetical protein